MRKPPITAKQVMAVVIPVVLITLIIFAILRPSSTPTPPTSVPATSSVPASVAPTSLVATESENSLGINIAGLNERVFRLEEALNMPPGDERDMRIRPIATPEGFLSTKRSDNGPPSRADQAAAGFTFRANRNCTPDCIQVEPFDKTTLSVFSRIEISVYDGERIVNTFTRERITNWVDISGKWMFAGEQAM
jgi:hypothetical protein